MINQYDKERYVWHIVFRLMGNLPQTYRPERSLREFLADTGYSWSAGEYEHRTVEFLCGDTDD